MNVTYEIRTSRNARVFAYDSLARAKEERERAEKRIGCKMQIIKMLHHYERMADDNRLAQSIEAHARAIEQHEAFRQEVSERDERLGEALYGLSARLLLTGFFENKDDHAAYERVVEAFGKPFILPAPDPLVEAIREMALTDATPEDADRLRAALAACGLEVRKIGEGE